MKLGEKLYNLRKNKNLSQEDVASHIGVSRQTVSKWETDASIPDLDKIIPLSNLFEISVEELLTDKKKELQIEEVEDNKKTAKVVAVSVIMYMVALGIVALLDDFFKVNDGIVGFLFFALCSIPTGILIFHFMSIEQSNKKDELIKQLLNKENTKKEQIKDVIVTTISILFTILYFIISFITGMWQITWLIWLLLAIILKIIDLFFLLGEKNED